MYEEHNVSRLGLVSIMRTVPENHRERWSERTVINGVPGEITCYVANPNKDGPGDGRSLGVPHGWDNEVVSAVHTLYIAKGCPADGTVTTTASNLLRIIGASQNGEYYNRLMESLDRLHNTHYILTEHWFNARKSAHTAANFTQFSDVQKSLQSHPFIGDDHQTLITVTLNRFIKENIEDEHLIRLNPGILTPLPSPTARAFYRLLETMRTPTGCTHDHTDTLQVDLNVLRSRARILSDDPRASRTKRIFDPALGLLKKLGYLKNIEEITIGRTLGYNLTFGDKVDVIDAVALEMLVQEGVSPSQARIIARDVERTRIKEVIGHVRERNEQGGVRSVPGLINTLLTGENARLMPSLRPRPTSQSGATAHHNTPPPDRSTPTRPKHPAPGTTQPADEEIKGDSVRNALALLGVITTRLKTPETDRNLLREAVQNGSIDITDLNAYIFLPSVKNLLELTNERTALIRPNVLNDPTIN